MDPHALASARAQDDGGGEWLRFVGGLQEATIPGTQTWRVPDLVVPSPVSRG